MINKTSWKFIAGFLALIAIGIVILLFGSYADPEAKQEREAKQYLDDLREQYENDPYGGVTPEETLNLFIEALEKGDVELASKYFVIDEQEEQLKYLQSLQNENQLELIIKDTKNLQLRRKDNEKAFFAIANENNVVKVQVIMGLGVNNKWKIYEL